MGVIRTTSGRVQRNPKGRPSGPKWLVDYLGYDYVSHVEQVELGPRNIEAVIQQVGQLDQLRQLHFFSGMDLSSLASAGIESLPKNGVGLIRGLIGLVTTDLSPPVFNGANFKYLKNMTRLEVLDLPANVSVTDPDLTHLSRLTALSGLELHDPRITDSGLVSLREMTKLNRLNLSGTQVSGAGLRSLRGMTALKVLNLKKTRVDDLSPIRHLTLLTRLDLSDTPINDKGLAPIAGMSGLNHVDLDGTQITSMSYAYFKHLPKLNDLWIENTQVGDEGSAALAELTALTGLYLN